MTNALKQTFFGWVAQLQESFRHGLQPWEYFGVAIVVVLFGYAMLTGRR